MAKRCLQFRKPNGHQGGLCSCCWHRPEGLVNSLSLLFSWSNRGAGEVSYFDRPFRGIVPCFFGDHCRYFRRISCAKPLKFWIARVGSARDLARVKFGAPN